ncbi:YifB family Mg chelatase-like AAA ATPase [Gardnerella vaginalis]|uniref:YifB family Mg chelatase-like AAA ATPase n=1 Tax=Gardnerella TaxID=2701 RepID=UPI0003538479|nr:YifB family Mg chelatase-like AAA ATPase [Gardnerella vaginalis]EPI42640.1 Mg chelatase-like protein [Gardnerella vaginalis JCP8481B]EPI42702.1 Mg chelatase-like protein [Gardnerella vaginalis JCP8481A]
MHIGNATSIGLIGLKAFTIQLQAFISGNMPNFSIVGLPDTSLSEARERVKSAHFALHCKWPEGRVTVNLSPASMPKSGASYDLAIAASILSAEKYIPLPELENTVILGELNLDGTVLPIQGMLPIALYAKKMKFKRIIIPQENLAEAQLVEGIETIGIHHILDLITQLHGTLREESLKLIEEDPAYQHMQIREHNNSNDKNENCTTLSMREENVSPLQVDSKYEIGDMAEVIGQEHTKWALQVAAAGGHHVMMIGPPGSGKTMLASRLPSIMCPLNEQEQLEVASIRSLCGTLPYYGISDIPPFEAPHHTASAASLIGGGTGVAKPGIITRAHCGVLFMDEAPEFSPRVLQTLREPLESGYIAISRSKGTTLYPAKFQLVIAANPCPCGYAYGNGERCTCKERERTRYFSRLSGPILDRIDIQMDVPPVERIIMPNLQQNNAQNTSSGTSLTSNMMRHNVIVARQIARDRFAKQGWDCNAQASGTWLRKYTSQQAVGLINQALEKHQLSLRGADRALRLAWTLADLYGHTSPNMTDIAQAISLRTRI